ncbi:MAG: hypothetical protein WBK28_00780 [Minisyncoccia bacterium]
MIETYIDYLVYASPGLMLLGYALYIRQTLRHEINPNPSTWAMFAYGTGLLAVLEFDRLGGWGQNFDWSLQTLIEALPLLALLGTPIACALCSLWVAGICLKRGKIKWPEEREDQISFGADILLTISYATAWGLLFTGYITGEHRLIAALVFLVGSNLTTITAFIPLLRQAKRDPGGERALPWLVWTLSYATLAIVTYHEVGLWSELMIYPIMNTLLHGSVALLALPERRKRVYDQELKKAFQTF